MNINNYITVIVSAWDSAAVPTGKLTSSGSKQESLEDLLYGLKYSDINIKGRNFAAETPLVYLRDDASWYYLGGYLLGTLDILRSHLNGKQPVFWDVPVVHSIETLKMKLSEGRYPTYIEPIVDDLWSLVGEIEVIK